MTREDVIAAFESPAVLAGLSTDSLSALVETHPCSAMVRMLYVKRLKDTDDIRFEHELNLAAAHLPARNKLYTWLKKPSMAEPIAIESPQAVEAPASEPVQASPIIEKEEVQKPKDHGLEELERQYLTEAVGISIGMEVEAEIQSMAKEESPTEDIEAETKDEATPTPKEDVHSADSFLDFISGAAQVQPPSENKKEAKPSVFSEAENLVERFMRKESREKVEFFDPARMAKASLVDNEELVTETLARVYQHQGNYKKAIRAYESLQLKYPDKRLYFAGRIERVKELIQKRTH